MTSDIRRELYQKVNKKKLFLRYRFEDISLTAAKAVIDYADGKTDTMPSCLLTPDEAREIALKRQTDAFNSSQSVNDSQAAKVQDSSAGNSELDRQFDLLTYRYSAEDKEVLFSYRNLLNELASFGITPEQLSDYLTQHEARQQNYIALQKEMIALKNEYRDLCRLKGYIDLAENDSFTHGPLFAHETTISKTSEKPMKREPGADISSKPSLGIQITDETISH